MTNEIIEIVIEGEKTFNKLCDLISDNINRDTAEFDRDSFFIDLINKFQ